MSATRVSYEAIAWCYQELAAIYSLGSIRAAKVWQVETLAPNSTVLYVGVGRGEDALLAARRGCRVVGLDLSAGMLGRLRADLAAEELRVDLVRGDLFEHAIAGDGYDTVIANFVLNIFPRPLMRDALAHLVSLVAPGGRLMVADFAPPSGAARRASGGSLAGGLAAFATRLYWVPLNVIGWALGLAALHGVHDLAFELESAGLRIAARRGFRPLGFGPVLYESLIGVRDDGA